MSDWKLRLTRDLEPVLMADDPRPGISASHDMPHAIFRYLPAHTFGVRQEVALPGTRPEVAGTLAQLSLPCGSATAFVREMAP